jgi:hypothetical protein
MRVRSLEFCDGIELSDRRLDGVLVMVVDGSACLVLQRRRASVVKQNRVERGRVSSRWNTSKYVEVLRENQSGAIGSYERDIVVPDLRKLPVKLSSVVLGTQTQPVTQRNDISPLACNGTMLVPSLTHVVSTGQPLYFYYEVHEPAVVQSGSPRLLTSIAFFRGKVKTYETPLVEVTRLDAPERKAAIFQYSVPASALKPGYYTCQITVVDDVAGTFAFPRLPLLVK